MERVNEETPNGGDYSEIFYFDKEGNEVDKNSASTCIIREMKNNGEMVKEIRSICN